MIRSFVHPDCSLAGTALSTRDRLDVDSQPAEFVNDQFFFLFALLIWRQEMLGQG
jgi:hypothetical protein